MGGKVVTKDRARSASCPKDAARTHLPAQLDQSRLHRIATPAPLPRGAGVAKSPQCVIPRHVFEGGIKAVGKLDNVNFVVLSGGSSLSSVVQESVLSIFRHIPEERFFLPDPRKPEDVETCLCAVAKGLAWLRWDGVPPIDFGD